MEYRKKTLFKYVLKVIILEKFKKDKQALEI